MTCVHKLRNKMTCNIKNQWIVIGISGVTCGGKTTLANQLKNILTPVFLFHQDEYFFPDDSPNHIKCKGLDHNNYDILSSLDMKAMYTDVLKTMKGEDKSHSSCVEKSKDKIEVKGKKFLVLEGFTVLNYEPLMELCNFRYYFMLEYGECALRRSMRLYDPPDVPGYFELCVWPEHMRYRQQIEGDHRVCLLDGTQPNALDLVLTQILSTYKPEAPSGS